MNVLCALFMNDLCSRLPATKTILQWLVAASTRPRSGKSTAMVFGTLANPLLIRLRQAEAGCRPEPDRDDGRVAESGLGGLSAGRGESFETLLAASHKHQRSHCIKY